MNPRGLKNFLTSKLGLFVVFLVVLFSGLFVYGRHQAGERQAARLAQQGAKKVELGEMHAPLAEGLEDGVPQQARPTGAKADKIRSMLEENK